MALETAAAGPARGISADPGWLDVKAFGAEGNGTADDTDAIQAAIDAGTHIYFPPGTYMVNQLFIADASDVVLCGYGATLKKEAGSVMWTRILDIASSENIRILGLTFDGNKSQVAGSPQGGCGSIYGSELTNFLFQDLTICNSCYGAVNLSDCHQGSITECSFNDIDVGILGMDRANSDIDIDHCSFTGGTSEGVSFGIYTFVTAEDFTEIGYHDHINITNCTFLNKNANCIQMRNVRNVLVANNILERTDGLQNTAGIMIDPDAVSGFSIVPDNIVIQSNRITGMRFEGIKVTGGTRIIIKNNRFCGIHSFNITAGNGCIIESNTFVNIQPGVEAIIYAQGRDITVLDNHFSIGSVRIPCVIGIASVTAGVLVQDNFLWKDKANPCVPVALEHGAAGAVIDEQGFSIIVT